MPGPAREGSVREAILESAHRLFVEQGFAATSTQELARAAGVTTGALYHHFGSKEGLYREVVGAIAEKVAVRAAIAMNEGQTPKERLGLGVQAVLDACLEPDVRLAYNEAATVLGLEAWRALEAERTDALLVAALASLDLDRVDLVAPVLKGAIVEGAMAIVTSDDQAAARRVVGQTLSSVIDALAAGSRPPAT